MLIRQESILASVGLLLLRVGFGVYMITHGWGKMLKLLAGELDAFADPIGLGSGISLILAVFAEVICAFLVVIGLGTRMAAVPLVITMAVAMFIVHANDPWTMGGGSPSREPAALYLIAFLSLIFTGPGRFSFDDLIWRRRAARVTVTETPEA